MVREGNKRQAYLGSIFLFLKYVFSTKDYSFEWLLVLLPDGSNSTTWQNYYPLGEEHVMVISLVVFVATLGLLS